MSGSSHAGRNAMRSTLGGLATQSAQPPAISVISSTKTISRSFALAGGPTAVDIEAAIKQLDERLRSIDHLLDTYGCPLSPGGFALLERSFPLLRENGAQPAALAA